MIFFSKHTRSTQEEIMDDFSLQGEALDAVMEDLKTVNNYLGGNTITIDGLKEMLVHCSKDKTVTIVDYGCGDGGFMISCAEYLSSQNWNYKLIGVDANANIIRSAKENCKQVKECTFIQANVFDTKQLPSADIALCTLFLHHFKTSEIITLLNNITQTTKVGVVINDLQRSATAFNLFKVFSKVFLKSKIAKFDGLVSIARSFVREDIITISEKIKNSTYTVKNRWAFRWQWLLFKN